MGSGAQVLSAFVSLRMADAALWLTVGPSTARLDISAAASGRSNTIRDGAVHRREADPASAPLVRVQRDATKSQALHVTGDRPLGHPRREGRGGHVTDVIRLLAEGLTNAEIAARLVLSVRTVDTHVTAILNKLDARTRRDAATRAKTLGLLDVNIRPTRTS
jgi:DNA-binding NarL/FixJ family response regulator